MPRPDQPLRVAYLVYRGNPHCGGQGVYTRELARELTALGHTVEVFSGQPYPDLVDAEQLTRVPSLDLYRPENPFRVPWPWEFKTRIDVAEFAIMCGAGFPEPTRSAFVSGSCCATVALTSTSFTTTSVSGPASPRWSTTGGRCSPRSTIRSRWTATSTSRTPRGLGSASRCAAGTPSST